MEAANNYIPSVTRRTKLKWWVVTRIFKIKGVMTTLNEWNDDGRTLTIGRISPVRVFVLVRIATRSVRMHLFLYVLVAKLKQFRNSQKTQLVSKVSSQNNTS